MEFTVVDGGVAVITLISAVLAYARGFTRELFAIGGWIVAIVAAYYLAPMLDPLMREAPVIGSFLAESCIISLIAAFTIVVALMLLVLSIFTPMFSNLVLDSVLGPLDRVLGFVFGVARGIVLIAIAFLIYVNFSGPGSWPALDNAESLAVVQESAALIEQSIPASVPDWFSARMETLMVNCEGVPADAPAATDLPATDLPATEPATEPGAAGETTGGTTGN
ncbi:MAG TPA: CvpA family protein [Thermohalobaculum sp.]|nr:CvpA family protein [Thermohalobaculum sp.]